MSKSIRVSDRNHERLVKLLQPRETFDDVVSQLLYARDKAVQLVEALQGDRSLREAQRAQLGGMVDADGVRRDVEARKL
uniref:Antitoxin n=1 Tax=viral metagenome TaxID=1070528 RepID=A0A6H2A2E3_9ZZZZ